MVLPVRDNLSEIDDITFTDKQVYQSIKRARDFVDFIKADDTPDADRTKAIMALGIYYSYLNWTTLTERRDNTFPQTSLIRASLHREAAAIYLIPMSKYPLNKDLTIDQQAIKSTTPLGFTDGPSMMDDYSEVNPDD